MSVRTTNRGVRRAAAGIPKKPSGGSGSGIISDLVEIAVGVIETLVKLTFAALWLLLKALWSPTSRQLLFRYRNQVWPVVLLGILVLAGWGATSVYFAVALLLSLLASGAALFHLRQSLDRRAEQVYALSCLAAMTTWLTLTSALGPDVQIVNVAGVLAWAAASIAWWQHHPVGQGRRKATQTSVQELWEANVGGEKSRAAAGAVLEPPAPIEHGVEYPVQGVPGVHHIGQMQSALPLIASGLRTPLQYLLLESEPASPKKRPDPSRFRLRVVERSPIDKPVFFTGPTTANGRIHLGPYADGDGDMTWRVFTDDSMWGGFVLGGTGAGKSRLIELIALVARSMGIAIIYLDGQEGASSPILWKHATWRGGPSEAKSILSALERGKTKRQAYNRVHGDNGLNPEPGGPTPIMTIIDECHKIFRPDTGERWGELAREFRKLLMSILAASQYSGLPTFGGNEALRSSLLDGNGLAMRISSRVSAQLIPGLDLSPAEFPALPGYSYYIAPPGSDARTAPGRGLWLPGDKDKDRNPKIVVPSVREWFERIPEPELDSMTAKAFGDDFLNRHEHAAAQEAADRRTVSGDEDGQYQNPLHALADLVADGVVTVPSNTADALVEAKRIEDEKGMTCAQQIMKLAWDDYSGEMERSQIIAELPPGLDVSTIRKALTKLVNDGDLLRTSHGNYQRPGKAS